MVDISFRDDWEPLVPLFESLSPSITDDGRRPVVVIVEGRLGRILWRPSISALTQLFTQYLEGEVSVWDLEGTAEGEDDIWLVQKTEQGMVRGVDRRRPEDLLFLFEHAVIFVLSDCASIVWYTGQMAQLLARWGSRLCVTILQMLPVRLWEKSALGDGVAVSMYADAPYAPNIGFSYQVRRMPSAQGDFQGSVPVPVIALDPHDLKTWEAAVARRQAQVAGYILSLSRSVGSPVSGGSSRGSTHEEQERLARERVEEFAHTFSPQAWLLLTHLAVAPISLAVVTMMRQRMQLDVDAGHFAEVIYSGLIEQLPNGNTWGEPDDVQFDFHAGVREVLLSILLPPELLRLLCEVSEGLRARDPLSIDVSALIEVVQTGREPPSFLPTPSNLRFGEVIVQVLNKCGPDLAALGRWLAGGLSSQEGAH